MKQPTFSVVTPSYNQGRFIEDTIKSVLSQAGDFFIEYIIMDGGSTDESVEIINKYDRLLREGGWPVKCLGIEYSWVSEQDEGQADAIEKGFERAHGDIGVWLNSDDTFYNESVFATVAGYFRESDVEMVVGNGVMTDRKGNITNEYRTKRIDLRELVFLDYHILQPSAFLKVRHYKGAPFDKRLNYTFDVDFFIRLLSSGIKYKKVPDLLSCFRIYPEIKTISGMGKSVKEYMLIERKVTQNRGLMFASWLYKYLSVVVNIKYGHLPPVRYAFGLLRSIFYLMIVGNTGRR